MRLLAACLGAALTAACHDQARGAATDVGAATASTSLVPFDPPERAVEPGSPDAAKIELGKLLFFDPRLSSDHKMSCATCHDATKGYADGLEVAAGHAGKRLARNTPTIVNAELRAPLFWDGRAATLEEQALIPVGNPDEMAKDVDELAGELALVPEYAMLFRRAFRKESIEKADIAAAIAAFERTIVSKASPYDRYLAGERDAMSAEAIRGMKLFATKARCTKCHDGPQLTDNDFHNTGVTGNDEGRYKFVKLVILKGAFKTPGLRDVAKTAPYFHDGSAKTLEAVVDHYDRGGDAKENIDPLIHPLQLAPDEKAAIVAFMKALTGKTPIVTAPVLPPPVPKQPP